MFFTAKFFTGITQLLEKSANTFFLFLCLFLSVCFPAVNNIWLETT